MELDQALDKARRSITKAASILCNAQGYVLPKSHPLAVELQCLKDKLGQLRVHLDLQNPHSVAGIRGLRPPQIVDGRLRGPDEEQEADQAPGGPGDG